MEPKPCFTVGIVGHINLPEGSEDILKARVREVFQWLRELQVSAPNTEKFGKPLGLEKTPIVLLSPLAPGADHLAAEVALELNDAFPDREIKVRCPMPFPAHIYRESTTFCDNADLKESRQAAFDHILDRIGHKNAFAVRHHDDPEPLREDSDWKIEDETFRNLRYRATGEFVAAHCDILIAICNQENRKDLPDKDPNLTSRSMAGTRTITASFINGLRPGILPIPPSLSWQDNGPLIRIFTPNGRTNETSLTEIGDVQIWHPEDSKQHGDNPKKIHEREMDELRELAQNIELLNWDLNTVEPDLKQTAKSIPDTVDQHFDAALVRLFLFGDSIDKLADRNNKVAGLLTKLSYLAGFLVFLCLAMAEGGRYLYLWIAIGLFIAGAVVRYVIRHVFSFFRKREDYRAIAEGLRVQTFWSSVGIRQSVASNYLQRLRGDISWLRSAIDSLIFPCDRFAEGFSALDCHKKKYERFTEVKDLWVRDQENYFAKGTYRKNRSKEVLSFLSFVCLTAGGFMLVINALMEAPFLSRFEPMTRIALAEGGVKQWVIWTGIVLGFASWFSISETRFALSFREKTSVKKLAYDLKVFGFFRHWSFRLATGVVLGFLIFSTIYVSGLYVPGESSAITSLSKATLIALGGLWLSYSNVIFAKEDAKRYSDMRGQFGAARRKLEYILQEYQHMIETRGSEYELEKMEAGIQELYLALGREALHEQTEWLLMRRSRPVEPVAKVR